MDIFCKVLPEGLLPLDETDREKFARLKEGSEVKVHITLARNIRFHRKFFALLRICYDNLPETIQSKEHIESVEALLDKVKADLGYYDLVNVGGKELIKLRSISFATMDETEFESFYNSAFRLLLGYLNMTEGEALADEVEKYTSRIQ